MEDNTQPTMKYTPPELARIYIDTFVETSALYRAFLSKKDSAQSVINDSNQGV